MKYTPMRYKPMGYMPLRYRPMRYTTIRCTPIKYTTIPSAANGLPRVRWLELTGTGHAKGSRSCAAGFTSHFLLFSPVLLAKDG
jgi:hypothetical protein